MQRKRWHILPECLIQQSNNPNYAGLLKYCIKHNHWSVFEQSSMTLEIEATRAIAAQILRHQRYVQNFPNV